MVEDRKMELVEIVYMVEPDVVVHQIIAMEPALVMKIAKRLGKTMDTAMEIGREILVMEIEETMSCLVAVRPKKVLLQSRWSCIQLQRVQASARVAINN